MSRSNKTENRNPAVKTFEWDGENGGFRYFDKTIGEKGERVKVDLPFRFLVLDRLATIRGYSDTETSGFWSNEVRNIKKDNLAVYTKSGLADEGLYDTVINSPHCVGAKYCQSVYIAFNEGGELAIGRIYMVGSALSSWIDFGKKNKVEEGAIEVSGMTEGKKGKTKYKIPTFTKSEVEADEDEQAIELDKQLQEYLKEYLARTATVVHSAPEPQKETEPASDLPYDNEPKPTNKIPF